MAKFRYKAATADGRTIEGQIDAHDRDSVARQIQAQGNTPIQISSADAPRATPPSGEPSAAPRLQLRARQSTSATVDFFTLELATLLRAGLPLTQALETLGDLAEEPALAEMIQGINKRVRGGEPLSTALEQTSTGFDPFYCNMVRAGESSGALDLTLERLASYRASRREMRQSLLSALIYPAILLVMAIVAVMVLLAFVVPQFTQMFAEAGRELPLLTRIVAGAGALVTDWWWAMLAGIAALIWWLQRDWRSPAGRARWDERLLKMPLVGSLIRNLAAARFARTMGSLLANGVNLVPALEIAKQIVGNSVIRHALTLTVQRVREGFGLAAPLLESQVFPSLATQLIRIGEASGKLEMMLDQVAEIYEREVQTTLKRLLTLAEPIIIITIALIITAIILSVVLMILESNDLAF